MADWTYNATPPMENSTNTSIDLPKTVSLILISACSLLGNLCTVAIVSSFRQHKLPDVLVIGLACTDLIATFIPVPMSLYSYITLEQFHEGSFACKFYGTVAQFTRYSSVLIVTLISLERYFAVNRPFIYRKHATPSKCALVLLTCWVIAFALAITPVVGSHTSILSHDGFCLFDFSSNYAISILVYAGIQYCIVLVCFVLVTAKLLRVYRRRKQLQVQGTYNQRSQAREREHEGFTRPKLSSRISDIGITLKKAAPILTERLQLGIEAQFAGMLFAVVALFYVSWTTLVILIVIAQAKGTQGQSLVLFWGIRLSVISLALNPLLYGLLAGQYRMAYLYVLRRIFSSCCCRFVDPPVKNIFVTARTAGGEPQEETQAASRHGRIRSINGSVLSGRPGLNALTRTTHISLDLLPQLDEGDGQVESMNEHSTYISSAGELSSTSVIPHQVRERCAPVTGFDSHPRASSENDLTEPGLREHPAAENNPGSHNPLAIIADIQGESAVTDLARPKKQFPPLEAINPHDVDVGKVYENLLYNGKRRNEEKTLSRSTPVSMLRSSKKARLQAKYSRETGKEQQKTNMTKAKDTVASSPNKMSVQKARSYPFSFLSGSKKKSQLRTTLQPTAQYFSEVEEGTVTSIDGLDSVADSNNLYPPYTTQRQSHSIARASARTYKDMKHHSKKTRPISSSQSFLGTPIAAHTESGVKTEEDFTDEPAVSMAPRYRLSLSPIPPPATPVPILPPGSIASSKSPMSISQPCHPEQALTPKKIPTPSVTTVTPAISLLSQNMDSSPLQQNTSSQLKCSVKELCQRYEFLSNTPPTSPRCLTLSLPLPTEQNCTTAHQASVETTDP